MSHFLCVRAGHMARRIAGRLKRRKGPILSQCDGRHTTSLYSFSTVTVYNININPVIRSHRLPLTPASKSRDRQSGH